MKKLNKLNKFVKSLGGEIKFVEKISDSFLHAVTFVGLDYSNKIIYHTKRCDDIFDLIHEAAHVFASKDSTLDDEEGFIGWELAMTKHVGLKFSDWTKYNENRLVFHPAKKRKVICICHLTKKQKKRVFRKEIKEAKRLGLVSKNSVPLSIRD